MLLGSSVGRSATRWGKRKEARSGWSQEVTAKELARSGDLIVLGPVLQGKGARIGTMKIDLRDDHDQGQSRETTGRGHHHAMRLIGTRLEETSHGTGGDTSIPIDCVYRSNTQTDECGIQMTGGIPVRRGDTRGNNGGMGVVSPVNLSPERIVSPILGIRLGDLRPRIALMIFLPDHLEKDRCRRKTRRGRARRG